MDFELKATVWSVRSQNLKDEELAECLKKNVAQTICDLAAKLGMNQSICLSDALEQKKVICRQESWWVI